jgi:hypothetical protein
MSWGNFFKGLANVGTGGWYGSLTGEAPGWSNDWLDTIMPGAGRITEAVNDWQDTGDWAETLNTLVDAPFGGVTGVSQQLGEHTVPNEVRGYAPAIGGLIGNYVGGPIVGSIGAGIGSDIAGGSAKDKYKSAGTAFAAGYGSQLLSGGGTDFTDIPAYDTSGVYSGEYATGDVDSGYYDAAKGTEAATGGTSTAETTSGIPFTVRSDLAPEGYPIESPSSGPFTTRANLAPAGYESMSTGAAESSGPFTTRYDLSPETYSPEPDANLYDLYNWGGPGSGLSSEGVSTSGGSGGGGRQQGWFGKAMPYVMGAGLISDTISSYKTKKANEKAAKEYMDAYNKAREEGTWNDTTRANYMKGVSGTIESMISGMKKRIGSNAAAAGRGGGYYGKNVANAQEQGRELYAKALADTYQPNFVAPPNLSAYLASQSPNWYDSLLSGVGSTAGKWPMLAYMFGK